MKIFKRINACGGTLSVYFEANPKVVDEGIGTYEFWGQKGFDSRKVLSIEEDGIWWDKSHYSELGNEIIARYLEDNYEQICQEFIDKYEN